MKMNELAHIMTEVLNVSQIMTTYTDKSSNWFPAHRDGKEVFGRRVCFTKKNTDIVIQAVAQAAADLKQLKPMEQPDGLLNESYDDYLNDRIIKIRRIVKMKYIASRYMNMSVQVFCNRLKNTMQPNGKPARFKPSDVANLNRGIDEVIALVTHLDVEPDCLE